MMFCSQFWFYCLASMIFSLKNPKILFILLYIRTIDNPMIQVLLFNIGVINCFLAYFIIGGKLIINFIKIGKPENILNCLFPPKQQIYSNMIERENVDLSDELSCRSLKNQQSICSLKSEGNPQKLQAPIFALNQQQMIMIQHKLPKGYCLLPLPSHFSKLKRKQTTIVQECLKFVNDKKRGRPEGSSRNQIKTSVQSERKSVRLACVKKVNYNKKNWQSYSQYNSDISQNNSSFEETENAQHDKQQERQKILQEKSSDISQHSLSSKSPKEVSKTVQQSAETAKLSDKDSNRDTIKQNHVQQILQTGNAAKLETTNDTVQKQERKVINGPLFRVQIAIKIPQPKDRNIENQVQKKFDNLRNIKTADNYDQKMEQSSKFADKFNQQFLILAKLKQNKSILPFLEPVNQQRDGAPNYYRLIASPIDLQTIEFKLQSHIYKEPAEFHEDVQRMWSNSFIYNKNNPFMYETTEKLQRLYQNLIGKRERMRSKRQQMQHH